MKIASWIAIVTALFTTTESDFRAAKLQNGSVQIESVQHPFTGGGQVLLELVVDRTGRVTDVVTLRSTPPFTENLANVVDGWRFTPARAFDDLSEDFAPTASRVLVAAVFRPATTYDAPALGDVPRDIASASEETPYPTSMVAPLYPPSAGSHTGRLVLVEIEVGEEGNVAATRVVVSSAGFDEVSLDAARRWRFRPAHRQGRPISSYVYVVFGFREPVAS